MADVMLSKKTYPEPRDPKRRKRLLRVLQGGLSHTQKMPKTRGDCIDGPRPCPWARCRHHMYADVAENGSLIIRYPDVEPEAMDKLKHTCSLDAADEGPRTLLEIGDMYGVTRERIRQIEAEATEKLYESAGRVYRELAAKE